MESEADAPLWDQDNRLKAQPKDPKASNREKYRRRLRTLASSLNEFIYQAEIRLDATKTGKIYKRSEVEALLESCKSLREKIPVEADGAIDERTYKNLCDFFNIPYDDPANRK